MARAVLFTPVPRAAAGSSLGFHVAAAGLAPCDRAVLDGDPGAVRAVGSGGRLSDFDAIFASVAWELEMPAFAASLRAAGIEPLRRRRPPTDPLVVGGGPLTLSNPDLLAACCDAVFLGEAEEAFPALRAAIEDAADRDDALRRLAAVPGTTVPAIHGERPWPEPVRAPADRLPARSTLPDEPNEFGDAFLVEVGRGCPRACTFCVVRVGVRRPCFVPADRILAAVPGDARRVGLLGAAVSDHPRLLQVVESLIADGREVTLGSVRADRVTPELLALLVRGGLRTLTVAADGTSEAVRATLRKDVTAGDLLRCAELAREAGVSRLKLYAMVGLPGETGEDREEFGALVRRLGARVRVSVSVNPFVPKRFTPLADAPFAGVRELKRHLAQVRKAIGPSAIVRTTSPREAEREYLFSHAVGEEAERLVLDSL